jgi:hypothetical protein
MKSTSHEDQYTFTTPSLLAPRGMRNVSDKFYSTSKYILRSIIFFLNRAFFLINMEKYCRSGQATADNMEHAHCMMET